MKPAIRGKLRRVPKKDRALRGQDPGRDGYIKNRGNLIELAPTIFFCNSSTHIFYHLIYIKIYILLVCEKHATVLQTQVARRIAGRASRHNVMPKSQSKAVA